MSYQGRAFIGTCGWSYRSWRGPFYPSKLPVRGYLSFYSQEFRTTEINCTFYHLPARTTFERWEREVPEDFRFAVKVNRLVTHTERLAHGRASWRLFTEQVAGLASHLGPLLLQFPPTFRRNIPLLEAFLDEVQAEATCPRLAMEFRHDSWFISEVYRRLARRGVALCIADSLRRRRRDVITTDFVYVRYHGRTPADAPHYSDAELCAEAKTLTRFTRDGLDVYAYFNNDAEGHAASNARYLRALLAEKGAG